MRRLTGDDGIAVVTGAGSGLGRQLALRLARLKFRVVAFGRQSAALEETRILAESDSRYIAALVLDVGDSVGVRSAFDRIADEYGPVVLLYNNAAVYPRRDFLYENPESFMDTVRCNLGGVVACTHAALLGMAERGFGRIVNVGSFADIAPLPASSAYSVSKGAARILTRALVADLGDRFPGIVISEWMPGMLRTGMGISDGIPPEVAARWGVELGLRCAPELNGLVFEQDREVLPVRSLKNRIKDAVLLRSVPKGRRLDAVY
jgi:NAD(P)-dependent dehydrogenase (short-subunit alcohol dehydrogenase family)